MTQTRMIANPMLPIASYSLSLIYAGVAGKALQNAFMMEGPAQALNLGNGAFSAGMAAALVTASLFDSDYDSFNQFVKDCKIGVNNVIGKLSDAFEMADSQKSQSNGRQTSLSRTTYQSQRTPSYSYSSRRSGWETWAPKAILAASAVALAVTWAHGLGKTVLEYGCEVGTANEAACNFFGLEYNERNRPHLWDFKR